MEPISRRGAFNAAFAVLIILAWLALWLWERSPYGRYLNHAELGGLVHDAAWSSVLLQSSVYVTGWLLMTTAMMLPTTLPLLDAFRRMTARRTDAGQLVALVVAGYLAVWLAFGLAAHLFDLRLHALLERVAWLQANPWVFGAGPLAVAGAFQFSTLKYRCLERCRAPVGFVIQHWRGGNPVVQSLAIGAHHGVFCVGCCWALMLLMFAVGTGSIGWMLALAAIMAIEKNVAWGRRLSTPLGLALLLWAAAIALDHAWSWQ
ncbi:DUF2182 domain-containing protein [Aromatoleum bremense]|uniref:DUF2182 domain-containing protein n=1 Tax=Aromatoleum bremense TaxID=76115 RepID=A0ABX1NV87_9RHOO|nr:DUF2182 domain-containing protein [Aromatoleum bremense]NMG15929.1 DUF2182 domain-containing protein [Aromatoleum bremense]QTQ32486.1 putative protein DUF2182 [Aromatoleum bremense]